MSKPYRPSNGSEGIDWDDQWCSHCSRDAAFREDPDQNDGCPIYALTFALDINHPDYPKEWIEDDDGSNPRCTAFTTDQKCPERCDKTVDLFAVSPATFNNEAG